jgi:hypothetical protein
LISYTDDVRPDASNLAEELKERMGLNVSADIHQIIFLNARKHGRVMVFNATFTNISIISYGGQFYWWGKL